MPRGLGVHRAGSPARLRRVERATAGRRVPMITRAKDRLDHLLVERGLAKSGSQARAFVLAGKVFVEGHRAEKAGMRIRREAAIAVSDTGPRFVGRGGVKLEAALEAFGISVSGVIALDVGASTGGFTDCLLRRGARRVYAVDVGYGQLDWALRNDPRVVVLERRNIRTLPSTDLPEPIGLAVIDVSFISIRMVLPRVLGFLTPNGEIIVLIKPQFEVGKGRVGRGGVVRQDALHSEVIDRLSGFAEGIGLSVGGVVPSPILGRKGNKEFLMHLRRRGELIDTRI